MTRTLHTEIKSGERLVATDITDLTFFPKGTILIFSSEAWGKTSANFKNIWKICDGTNGTPDLVDKFLRGSTASGVTGGGTAALSEANLPSHTHGVSGSAQSAGNHTHTLSVNTGGNPDGWGDYGRSYWSNIWSSSDPSTNSAGAHTHTISGTAAANTTHTAAPFDVVPKYYTVIYIMKVA
jgi:hypothetical protein